ncbi:hypothetical protein MRB53_039420 [Persea americana]|nr:hypothetical protein MRB53_039420 [Persea americana]
MTPFAGEGVNLAFTDAMKLANMILASGDSREALDQNIAMFERDMFARATLVQQKDARHDESHVLRAGRAEDVDREICLLCCRGRASDEAAGSGGDGCGVCVVLLGEECSGEEDDIMWHSRSK